MDVQIHTIETFAKAHDLTRQSALNKISALKEAGFVQVSGGGPQKRIYKIANKPFPQENGFYTIVNKYSPEKLVPRFTHVVVGNYTVERAIIDGIKIGDVRTLQATKHLFNQVTNWKRLFDLSKKHNCEEQVIALYNKAKQEMRVRRMPKRYQQQMTT